MHNAGWMLTFNAGGEADAAAPNSRLAGGRYALGHDGRVSSRLIARELLRGEPGEPLTLAAFSAALKGSELSGGVYLTGAWMPQEFAGAALLDGEGRPAAWSEPGEAARPEFTALAGSEHYLQGIRSRIDLERVALIPRSFVFDLMYGPGAELLDGLLKELPGHLKLLPFREYEPEARETITPCPYRGAPLELAKRIDKHDAEAGFIIGGGSGIRQLSNNGNPVGEGALGALALYDLKKFREFDGALIRHAAVPRGVDLTAKKLGVEIEECFSETELCARVAQGGAILGLLPGGRLVFPGPSAVPDPIQAALAMLELNSHTDLPPHLVLKEHLPEALEGGHAVSGLPLKPGQPGADALAKAAAALKDQGLDEVHTGALCVLKRGEERLTLAVTLDGGALEIRADAADQNAANSLAGVARNVLVRSVL